MARKSKPTPLQPAVVIRRGSEDRTFRGPTTVNQFAGSGFKAKDRGAQR